MDVACNDLIRQRIIEKIRSKENELKESYINLKKTAIENKFFSSVLEDYEQYYDYIKDEKQKQIVVLNKIAEHLDKLIMNTSVLNDQASVLKDDQRVILERLATVKHELEEIT